MTESGRHLCPVGWSADRGLNGLVDRSWCFDSYAPKVRDLPADPGAAFSPAGGLQLATTGRMQVFYAPFDAVNPEAKVTLVGITPGRRVEDLHTAGGG